MRGIAVLLGALLAVVPAGCLRGTEYRCAGDEQCSGGVCQPVGYCSFLDASCSSGQRFADSAGEYANTCVGGDLPDAGVDMADAPPDQMRGCPDNYMSVTNGQGDHVYRVIVAQEDWDVQVAACSADGSNAYLAIPDDATELQAISSLFMVTQNFWVGISDLDTEGTFVTVRNTPAAFLPWDDNQPNNTNDSDCVSADRIDQTYNDQRCNTNLRAVCECEP